MSVHDIPTRLRGKDEFHHIDMGFLNRRLCMRALRPDIFRHFHENQKPGSDHMTVLTNDHLLVTALLDTCKAMDAPTLVEALTLQNPTNLFRSTERLAPCPEVYEAERVCHAVLLDFDFAKPVYVAYHTSHLVSETGKMILVDGAPKGRVNSIIGLLHSRPDRFEVEPFVIGQPWFDHWRNGDDSGTLMALGRDFGEILPEDIDQFSEMTNVKLDSSDEWLRAMRSLPEADVKRAFADLLSEPIKNDWSGEENDHFSANVSVHGGRLTAAFLLKGPSVFREMTLDMCGKRADQIPRLTKSGPGVLEVVARHDGDTFRAVYTVRFETAVYVLHAFQKKARRGIATPKQELDLVRRRLQAAERHYRDTHRGD